MKSLNRPCALLLIIFMLAGCGGPQVPPNGDVIATLPPVGAAVENGGPAVAGSGAPLPSGSGLITDALAENDDLLFAINALNSAGLWPLLEGEGPFTFFAPANVAFSKTGLAPQQMDPDELFRILQNHIVTGIYTADNLAAGLQLTTLAGEEVVTGAAAAGPMVAYSQVTAADIGAANGVVHIVDNLLLPPEQGEPPSVWGLLNDDGRFTQLVGYLAGTELMYMLRFNDQPDAFLAPTDAAFATLPAEIRSRLDTDPHFRTLLFDYHLLTPDGWPTDKPLLLADIVTFTEVSTQLPVAGSGFGSGFYKVPVSVADDGAVLLDGAAIIEPDLLAANAAVHVLDTVLVPAALLE